MESRGREVHLNWIDLLALLGVKYGGDFSKYKERDMEEAAADIEAQGIEKLTKDMKYYAYYREAYGAVLGGMVGSYEAEDETGGWKPVYGLKACLLYTSTKEDFLTLFQSYDEYGTTVLQYDNMSMYSKDAENLLMQGGAKTVVYAAMYCEGQYTGAISYVTCQEKRYWSKQGRKQLGEVTKIISAHLAKNQVMNSVHQSGVAAVEMCIRDRWKKWSLLWKQQMATEN